MKLNLFSYWYSNKRGLIYILLRFLSFLFLIIISIRRFLYRHHILSIYHFTTPIIVVGNLTVGGTGKTPFVIALAKALSAQGLKPAIICRGIGGKRHYFPYWMKEQSLSAEVGDEALLLKRNSLCPVVVCIKRHRAVKAILAATDCDVIINDDGLQHYALARDVEIVLIDGLRLFGNRCLLPAGPLRENTDRLASVDFVVINKRMETSHQQEGNSIPIVPTSMQWPVCIRLLGFYHLCDRESFTIDQFTIKKAHAVAAIGHPQQFFTILKKLGIEIVPHAFPDHHAFIKEDFHFQDQLPIIITEKDAVKCEQFADERFWFLKIEMHIPNDLLMKIISQIQNKKNKIKYNQL